MRIFNKVFMCLSLLLLLTGCQGRDQLTVVFPKVGSADAALLMTDQATVLIDTGEADDGDKLLNLLEAYGRDTIDVLIISHYDKDHVGGAAAVLNAVPVGRVIGSTWPKESDATAAYYQALEQAGLTEEHPSQGMVLSLGQLELSIDVPARTEYNQDQSNNSSLIVTASYGQTRLLFAGDAMAQRLGELDFSLPVYNLVKIPHHGRDSDAPYLSAMKPGAAAIITSSKKEPENDSLTSDLSKSGLVPWLTRNGAVTAVSDGQTLTVTQS